MEIVMLILIMVICVVVYKMIAKRQKKTTKQLEAAVGENIDDSHITRSMEYILVNSPHYNKYKSLFDWIIYKKEPKYKVEWLLKSLNLGRELECNGAFVMQSVEKGLPYFCETEREFDEFFKSEKPVMKGSIHGMLEMGFFYHEVNKDIFLQEKRAYWKNCLIEMAQSGNLGAQAALCSGKGGLFEREEIEKYKGKYEENLFRLAEDGDPYAQLGLGQYIEKYKSKESFNWLRKAGEQGLSDAWYYMAKSYESLIYADENFVMREKPLEGEALAELEDKIVECYLKGAVANNGILAAECQCRIASCYEDGHLGLTKDIAKSIYWYERAFENGSEYAGSMVEVLSNYCS